MTEEKVFYNSVRASEQIPWLKDPDRKTRYRILNHEIPPRLVKNLEREMKTDYNSNILSFAQKKITELNKAISKYEKRGSRLCYETYRLPRISLSQDKAQKEAAGLHFNDKVTDITILELARISVAVARMKDDVKRDAQLYRSYDLFEDDFRSFNTAENSALGFHLELRRPYVIVTVPNRGGFGYETYELAGTRLNRDLVAKAIRRMKLE